MGFVDENSKGINSVAEHIFILLAVNAAPLDSNGPISNVSLTPKVIEYQGRKSIVTRRDFRGRIGSSRKKTP